MSTLSAAARNCTTDTNRTPSPKALASCKMARRFSSALALTLEHSQFKTIFLAPFILYICEVLNTLAWCLMKKKSLI